MNLENYLSAKILKGVNVMNFKKIIISALIVVSLFVMATSPILAANNIILIQDSYHYVYTENCSPYKDDCVYLVTECGTSAGEAQRHRAVSEAISVTYGSTIGYGSFHAFHSSATATQFVGSHSDFYNNYYELG